MKQNGPFILALLLALGAGALSASDSSAYAVIPALAAGVAVCAGLIQRDARQGALATAALCLACASYLFSQKLALESGASLCNINDIFNCDKVNSSEYSILFGLPVPLLGMGFYAGVLVAGLLASAGTDGQDSRFHQVVGLFALPSIAYSVFLGWASAQIGAFCVVCITMYAGNALLLWASMRGLAASGGSLSEGLVGAVTSTEALTVAFVFLAAVGVGNNYWLASTSLDPDVIIGGNQNENEYQRFYSAVDGVVELSGAEPLLGNPNGKYTVVEWADFGCPHCARAGKRLKELVANSTDVQVRYRYFPLSGGCNEVIPEDQDPGRCVAAYAAECAKRQGRFWEMSEQLFENQGYFGVDEVSFMAKELGLDPDAFATCLDDPTVRERVMEDAKAGDKAGVAGTPAMYLRGTHGERFIQMTFGVRGLLALLEADRDGVALPAPTN